MIPAEGHDALIAACAFLASATQALRASTRDLRTTIDALVSRDSIECPPPKRAVLVLHDDASALWALSTTIRSECGVAVLEASTVAEARVQMRERPALVVSDYHLGDGVTCAALLRDRPAWMRALIVTGRTGADALATIAAGVGADVRVLSTPVTDEEQRALVDAVRNGLGMEDA